MITAKENRQTTMKLVKDWNLGPKKASEDLLHTNGAFWKQVANKWYTTVSEARRRNCGNCEYGDTSPEALKSMEVLPMTSLDRDGGGRVWCEKFDFICHNLRVCTAWDGDKEEEN